jgi:hypothetical protein
VDIGLPPLPALSSKLTYGFVIGNSSVVDITVRMDGLLRSDFRKRIPMKGGTRRKFYEISIDVEMSVKRAVILDVKHENRVLATYATTSL